MFIEKLSQHKGDVFFKEKKYINYTNVNKL